MTRNVEWNAVAFFRDLTQRNKLAQQKGFAFREVSGLAGIQDAIESAKQCTAFVMVSDTDAGTTVIDNSPHNVVNKIVILSMRHKMDDAEARKSAMDTLSELFAQFASVLIKERTRLAEKNIFLSPNIQVQTFTQYIAPGVATKSFTLSISNYTDLRYSADDWLPADGE